MLDTGSLADILRCLRDGGYISSNPVLETAVRYEGDVPQSVPVRGSFPIDWPVFQELLARHLIERLPPGGRAEPPQRWTISEPGMEHLRSLSALR